MGFWDQFFADVTAIIVALGPVLLVQLFSMQRRRRQLGRRRRWDDPPPPPPPPRSHRPTRRHG